MGALNARAFNVDDSWRVVINESLTRRLIPLGVIGSTTVFGAVSPGSNPDGGTQMDRTDLNGLLARVWRNLVNAVDLKSITFEFAGSNPATRTM